MGFCFVLYFPFCIFRIFRIFRRINSRQQLQNRPSSVRTRSAKTHFATVNAILTAVYLSIP